MLVCLCGHNYSSCDNVLVLIRFHVSYGSGTPCCSEMCNLSAVILPVITFQRYPTSATSVQTRSSALVLRLTKFHRYPIPTPSVHTSCSAFRDIPPRAMKLYVSILTICYKTKYPNFRNNIC